MTDLGSGIELDGYFDLSIASTGDVGSASGIDELSKDIAVVLAEVLTTGSTESLPDTYDSITVPSTIAPSQDPSGDNEPGGVLGILITDGVLNDIEVLTANIIGLDERVDTVLLVEASRPTNRAGQRSSSQIDIEARVRLADDNTVETLDLIIPPNQ